MPAIRTLTGAQARELERASQLLQAGHASEALGIAQRLLSQAALAADAHHVAAICHAHLGRLAEAESAFSRALELAPGQPAIRANYAKCLRDSGAAALARGDAGAAVLLRRAVELEEDSTVGWHLLGQALRAGDDLEGAAQAFRHVLALAPDDRAAAVNLAVVLRLLGRSDEAAGRFARLLAAGESSPEVVDAAIGAMVDAGQVEQAIGLARGLVAAHPRFVPGLATLAMLLWEHDDPSVALRPFEQALAQDPADAALRLGLADLMMSAQRYAEVLALLDRSHGDGVAGPALSLLRANALAELGRHDEAGALYATLYRQGGDRSPTLLNAQARHLLRTGDWRAAERRAMEATRIDPAGQEAWAWLGVAWRLLGDAREEWLCGYDTLVAYAEVEAPAGFTDLGAFLAALAPSLEHLHQARHAPLRQTLRAGSQTPGRLFGRNDPLLDAARGALLATVDRWLATLPDDDRHPFLARRRAGVRIAGSWSARLRSSGSHVNHVHPQGWASSAFHVRLPPSVSDGRGGGQLALGAPPVELQLGLPPRRTIQPRAGSLALFPSFLWHGTTPFDDPSPRVTIAFDMVPSGTKSAGAPA